MEKLNRSVSDPVRPVYPFGDEVGPGAEEEGEPSGVSEEKTVVQRPPPKGPTEAQRAAHRKTHLPFRPWCPECVRGRGKNWPHPRAKGEEEERQHPTVAFDYCFMRDETGGPSVSVLVGKEKESGSLIAHVVPQKGAGLDWTIKQVCRDLVKLGVGTKVTLKAD